MKIFCFFYIYIFLFLHYPCTILPIKELKEAGETIRIHLNDESKEKIIISYTKNQKITFTIDKFIPKVMEIDTYLSNVYFSQIHYAKTKIVLFFNMNVVISTFETSKTNQPMLLKLNNLACYLYIEDMYFTATEDKSFSYGATPTIDRIEISLKEIKEFAIFSEIFENDMQIFKDNIRTGFIKHLNRVLSKYPVGTVKSLVNLILIQLTEGPYIVHCCKEEGVTKAIFTEPNFLRYNAISSQYGELIEFSVTVTYDFNNLPLIYNLNLNKILIGIDIGFSFKEGTDEIGKKVLVEIMTELFESLKEKKEE